MDIPAWISAACAVLTLIGAAVSWLRSNVSKQAKAAAESARDEAQRTVEAAEQTAKGVQRLADTLAEANSAPPWEVKWEKDDTYALINTGNAALNDVEVDIDTDNEIFMPPTTGTIDAKSSVVFMYARHMGSDMNVRIVVTWTDPDGTQRAWRHPIPQKRDGLLDVAAVPRGHSAGDLHQAVLYLRDRNILTQHGLKRGIPQRLNRPGQINSDRKENRLR